MYYIGIEDLVANALIEIVERTGKRTVSFSQLNEYGEAVVERLKIQKIDATLLFNRNLTNRFFYDYTNYFKITETSSDIQVTLKSEITTKDLRNRFRTKLSLDVLKAFVSEEPISILFMSK